MLQLTTTVQQHQVKANCNTNINILGIELFLFAMEIIHHSHHSSTARGKEAVSQTYKYAQKKIKA